MSELEQSYRLICKQCIFCDANFVYKKKDYEKPRDYCMECLQQIEVEELLFAKNVLVFLNVNKKDEDEAKSMGAKWDEENKRWYAPNKYFAKELIERFS